MGRKHDKNILKKIKYPKYVIGITGSSGKGSTTSLVAHILENAGLKGLIFDDKLFK